MQHELMRAHPLVLVCHTLQRHNKYPPPATRLRSPAWPTDPLSPNPPPTLKAQNAPNAGKRTPRRSAATRDSSGTRGRPCTWPESMAAWRGCATTLGETSGNGSPPYHVGRGGLNTSTRGVNNAHNFPSKGGAPKLHARTGCFRLRVRRAISESLQSETNSFPPKRLVRRARGQHHEPLAESGGRGAHWRDNYLAGSRPRRPKAPWVPRTGTGSAQRGHRVARESAQAQEAKQRSILNPASSRGSLLQLPLNTPRCHQRPSDELGQALANSFTSRRERSGTGSVATGQTVCRGESSDATRELTA